MTTDSTEESSTSTPSAAASEAHDSEELDPREQMRQALEKKNAQTHAGQAHLEGRAKAGGEHSKAGGTRQFRRKSGG